MGESGTGKELFARAIHDCSGRTGEFVPVNTAGLDGTLFSDVLFGHSKGAYTGAEATRSGLIKKAEGGTLFLDEIGDIAPDIQVKLLRLLQDGEYYPLGSDKPERTGCRIVLATNVNLHDAVQAGTFRADLYYRLIIHPLAIPPLRGRSEDIPALIDHYAALAEKSLNIGRLKIEPAFYEAALAYDFPGNVRELSAIVYGAAAASDSKKISLPYLSNYISQHRAKGKQAASSGCEGEEAPFATLEEVEDRHIREALRRAGGNQTEAASLLGISQSTISRKLKQSKAT
jgi:transcriptional regulator with PAS, ATPase and Fis domain